MKVVHVGTCIDGNFTQPGLVFVTLQMPKVPSKMESCIFNVCARVAEPFVNDDGCRTGLEISVINILQQVMGFDVSIITGTFKIYYQ